MKNYAVLADLKAKATFHIEKAFDRGYDQGFNDCHSELTEEEAKDHYKEGYNDGYRKGVEHGKEARVAEADCAYQCGMNRAWEAARKIVLSPKEGGLQATTVKEIFGMPYESALMKYSARNAVEMIEAWEKKQEQEQEQSKKCCKDCNHYCGDDNKFKCDIKGLLCIERDRWTPKQKQTEKSCSTCANLSEENEYSDFCWDECDNLSEWTPKQNVPETNVRNIENRNKIVKALAGLLAAYGDQIWDVAADMQKNP